MSKKSKKEYLEKMRIRYAGGSGKKGKTVLIDEFCEVTAQIDRLLGPTTAQNPNRRIRTPKSNQAMKAVTPIRAESWDVHEPGWTTKILWR